MGLPIIPGNTDNSRNSKLMVVGLNVFVSFSDMTAGFGYNKLERGVLLCKTTKSKFYKPNATFGHFYRF